MERYNLKGLNDVEVKEKHQVNISNRFAVLKKFDNYNDDVDINRAWESIRI
jgi:hypothetical protein